MTYRNDVAEARRLVKRSEIDQWRLAELTWRNTKPQGDASMTAWATDIGYSRRQVARLTRVWATYGAMGAGARPSFSDAMAKLETGNPDATGAGNRADKALQDATPAAVAALVAESPDHQRAIARNQAAMEGVEEYGIEHRARHAADDPDPAKVGRAAGHKVRQALGAGDAATDELLAAARCIASACVWRDEYGINDTAAEDAAIARIKRWLRIYEGKTEWTDADSEHAAEMGIKL